MTLKFRAGSKYALTIGDKTTYHHTAKGLARKYIDNGKIGLIQDRTGQLYLLQSNEFGKKWCLVTPDGMVIEKI